MPWEPNSNVLRVVTISDTHSRRPPIPPGDIFIHAGDLTGCGTADQLRAVVFWISGLLHPIKLIVAGNHDACLCKPFLGQLDGNTDAAADIDWNAAGITYLEHSSSEIQVRGRTLKVFGSPYTPAFGNWAFQYPSSYRPAPKWDDIPCDTDILITHGPVRGLLDQGYFGPAGCSQLKTSIEQIRPFLHVFGHIHEARGHMNITWDTGVCNTLD
ncbi:Metallo-dependent phosphatase [Fistulina hepatica ATCC 64428]|uniref:Metallo-dependent phosphatase n=1 Tax=Fistulina hepatica ATCC 64428 TaxID=1128425 RepID=A0A0D7AQS3_9AGAR|nr:Metallo-dependent phosphatase [Fistulina hepatica ATCC 64428]